MMTPPRRTHHASGLPVFQLPPLHAVSVTRLSFHFHCPAFNPVSLNSGRAGQHLLDPPSLAGAQRTRFDNSHTVPYLAHIIFIVRQKFRGSPQDFFIQAMLDAPVHRNSHRFLHTCACYDAYLAFANSPSLFSSHSSLDQFEIGDSEF
jgi:hypothetical protein